MSSYFVWFSPYCNRCRPAPSIGYDSTDVKMENPCGKKKLNECSEKLKKKKSSFYSTGSFHVKSASKSITLDLTKTQRKRFEAIKTLRKRYESNKDATETF